MIELWLFTSNDCPGCDPMRRKVEMVISEMDDVRLKVFNVDEKDEYMDLARAFYIQSTPTLLIKKGDTVVDHIIGNVSLSTIEEALNGY